MAKILSTAEGRHLGAFSLTDWSLFVSIGLIWGTSFLLIEVALRSFAPGVVTWGRVVFGATTLALLPGGRTTISRSDRPRVLVVAALWVAIPWTLFPLAQQYVTSAVAGIMNGGMPILAAIVAAALLRRLPRPLQISGLLIGAGGVAAIAAATAAGGSSQAIGVLMLLGAIVCYAFAINIVGPLQQSYGSVGTMARVLAYATVMTAPFGLWSLPASTFSWQAFGAVLILGVFGSAIAFAMMARLVGHVGTTRAAFAVYLVPVVATILGAAILDERVTALDVVGMAMVIVGAVIASRPARRERRSSGVS